MLPNECIFPSNHFEGCLIKPNGFSFLKNPKKISIFFPMVHVGYMLGTMGGKMEQVFKLGKSLQFWVLPHTKI
jgi:hypothetical protein